MTGQAINWQFSLNMHIVVKISVNFCTPPPWLTLLNVNIVKTSLKQQNRVIYKNK